MRIHFILNKGDGGVPEALLAEIEVHFEEGLLAGLKLVGCSVWRAKKENGKVTVLVPSRSYAGPQGNRYFELLRDSQDGHKQISTFKKYIRAEYLKIAEVPA